MEQMGDSILSLERNRLSGNIPPSFHKATNISILDGNMFQCGSKASLPQQDPDVESYICGSDIANISLFTFSATLAMRIALCCCIVFGIVESTTIRSALYEMAGFLWSSDAAINSTRTSTGVVAGKDLDILNTMFRVHRWYFAVILGATIVIFLPTYIGLKATASFSSHTFQYGWLPSLGFMQHYTPATTMFTLWMVILPVLAWFDWFMCKPFRYLNSLTFSHSAAEVDTPSVAAAKFRLLLVAVVLNVCVVVVVNGAYVYSVLTQAPEIQFAIIIVTSMFKVGWSMGVVDKVMRLLNAKRALLLVVTVVNNIVLPIVGTIVVDISCYQNVFVPAAEVSTTLVLKDYECRGGVAVDDLFNGTTCSDLFLVSWTEPPFLYSGQCSDSVLTNYVPIYITMFGILNAFIQLSQMGVLCYFSGVVPKSDGDFRERLLSRVKMQLHKYEMLTFGIVCFRALPLLAEEGFAEYCFRALPLLAEEGFAEYDMPNCVSMYKLREMGVASAMVLVLMITYGAAYPRVSCDLCAGYADADSPHAAMCPPTRRPAA